MAAFDYKKEYKELYQPKPEPGIVTVPPMSFAAVKGRGNPNEKDGEYSSAVGILYAVSYTIKMNAAKGDGFEGGFAYVVPPLEGLWWMEDGKPGVDYSNKSGFCWISMIRLADFVTPEIFAWAKEEAARKKKIDTGKAEFFVYDEGLCVQSMHTGSYDDEPQTIARMDAFAGQKGYRVEITPQRRHHEIYLSDPRRCAPEKCKTVIRHPIAEV